MTKKAFRKWSRNHNHSSKKSINDSPVYYNNINLGNKYIFEVLYTSFRQVLQEANLMALGKNAYITLDNKKKPCYVSEDQSKYGYAYWFQPIFNCISHRYIMQKCDINFRSNAVKNNGLAPYKQELSMLPGTIKYIKRCHRMGAWLSVNKFTFFNVDMFSQMGRYICGFVHAYHKSLLSKHDEAIYAKVARVIAHAIKSYKKYGDVSLGSNYITNFD